MRRLEEDLSNVGLDDPAPAPSGGGGAMGGDATWSSHLGGQGATLPADSTGNFSHDPTKPLDSGLPETPEETDTRRMKDDMDWGISDRESV